VKSYHVFVDGMTCEHCADRVAKALRAVGGVRDAAVDLASRTAMVTFDESRCGMATLAEAVRQAGFSIGGFRDAPPPAPA